MEENQTEDADQHGVRQPRHSVRTRRPTEMLTYYTLGGDPQVVQGDMVGKVQVASNDPGLRPAAVEFVPVQESVNIADIPNKLFCFVQHDEITGNGRQTTDIQGTMYPAGGGLDHSLQHPGYWSYQAPYVPYVPAVPASSSNVPAKIYGQSSAPGLNNFLVCNLPQYQGYYTANQTRRDKALQTERLYQPY